MDSLFIHVKASFKKYMAIIISLLSIYSRFQNFVTKIWLLLVLIMIENRSFFLERKTYIQMRVSRSKLSFGSVTKPKGLICFKKSWNLKSNIIALLKGWNLTKNVLPKGIATIPPSPPFSMFPFYLTRIARIYSSWRMCLFHMYLPAQSNWLFN